VCWVGETDFIEKTHFFKLTVEAEGIEPSSEVRPAFRASTGLASAFL